MTHTGKIYGRAASKFPAYRYRRPITSKLRIRDMDPNRLNWMNEYPRDKAIFIEACKFVEVADYEVRLDFGGAMSTGRAAASVILLPGKYTIARVPLIVLQADISQMAGDEKIVEQELLHIAFGDQ